MNENKIVLKGLSSSEYEHPLDKKYLDILEQVPGLPLLSKKIFEWSFEKVLRIQSSGSYLRITEDNMPNEYHCLKEAAEILDINKIPDLYINWDYSVNAFTSGVEDPFIVMNSGCIDLLEKNELMFILGHELGHIKSGHVLYHTMSDIFPALVEQAGQLTLGIAGIAGTGIQIALNNWYRMSEFTADRAGFLVCQDQEAGMKTLIKLAGIPNAYNDANFQDSFMKQAKEFEDLDDETLNRIVKLLTTLERSHPWTVMRGSEYIKWNENGEYNKLLSKNRNNKICSNCKKENLFFSKFCRECGQKL
tara:strand:+ start:107 stop:1021 length:915 start_codon:yes stop_codon:yes gene_type:complete